MSAETGTSRASTNAMRVDTCGFEGPDRACCVICASCTDWMTASPSGSCGCSPSTRRMCPPCMGVSQPTVAGFERYDANPRLSTVRRYTLAVGARLCTTVIDDCADRRP